MLWSSEAIPLYFLEFLGEPDARVKEWFLLNSPLNLIIIYVVYFSFVLLGPKFMEQRNPFLLRKSLIIYNCFQIAFSAYLCKEMIITAYLSGHKITCTHLDTSNSKLALRIATTCWLFYISKIIDLIDTVFFILRKKNQQLTFLHVYHHSTMVFNWYLGVLYIPGGQASVSVCVNSFIHVIMYFYYLLSAMGPQVQKYLWWKKYLTQMQLVQFVVILIHLVVGSINGCHQPVWLVYFTFFYLWSMVFLFLNFYVATYEGNYKKEISCYNNEKDIAKEE